MFALLVYGLHFIFLLLALIALYSGYIVWVRSKYRHIPGPPVKYFFLGNGQELNFNRVDNHLIFIKWAKEYGPLYKLYLFHRVIIFACSPELGRELLTKSRYGKSVDLYTRFKTVLGVRFMGNGLATNLDYDDWKIKRQALNPAFHRSFLEKLIFVFNEASDNLIAELNIVAESRETIPVLKYLHQSTLEVIAKVAFSFDIKESDPDGNFSDSLYLCMKINTEIGMDITLPYNPFKRKYKDYVIQRASSIRHFVGNILDKRLADSRNGLDVPHDILTIMLQNLSQICSKEEIIDEMVTLFIAGQETTANILSFCLMELGRHPNYLNHVTEEIDLVVGNKDFITHEDLDKLDWVNAVIKETLRLYPPTGSTAREMPDFGILGGYKLPKKTDIIVSFFAIHHVHHINGSEFRPEWWLSCNSPKTEFNFMPFSLGQRSCIGKQFGYTEMKILLCKILQKFEFKLDPSQRLGVENAATFRPVDGVRVIVSARNVRT